MSGMASQLFTQSFVQAEVKENISASLAFMREIHRDRRIPLTKGQ